MSNSPAYTIIRDHCIVIGDKSIQWDHPKRDEILRAIRESRWADAEDLMTPARLIVAFGLEIVEGKVVLDGEEVDDLLNLRILDMIEMNLPVAPLAAFIRKTRRNPSYTVQRRLYEFMEHGKLPITADGNFLARKFTDMGFMSPISSIKVSWAPGEEPEMKRSQVDDDGEHTCSRGLHVYSKEYAAQMGFSPSHHRMVVCEIDPVDVVAVPPDYNNTKMRICKAKVLKEITKEDDPEFFGSLVYRDANCCCERYDDADESDDWANEDVVECTECGKFDPNNLPIDYCPACGTEVDRNDTYCSKCGTDLTEYIDSYCFCQYCGCALE